MSRLRVIFIMGLVSGIILVGMGGILFFSVAEARVESVEQKIINNPDKRARELYNSGKDYYQSGGFSEALIQWDKLLSLSPNYYREIDKYLKKIEKVPLIPKEIEILSRMKEKVEIARRIEGQAVKHYRRGKKYYTQGEYSRALNEFGRVLSLKPGDGKAKEYFIQSRNRSITPQEYIKKAYKHLNNGKYKMAQEELKIARSIYPKNNNIRRLFHRLNRLNKIDER